MLEASPRGRKFFAACTPGYYSNEGVVDTETKSLAATFPGGLPGSGGIPIYQEMLKQQQDAASLARLEAVRLELAALKSQLEAAVGVQEGVPPQ